MSEIRSVEVVCIDGNVRMYTKINGVPVDEVYGSWSDPYESVRSLPDKICKHLGIPETTYDE